MGKILKQLSLAGVAVAISTAAYSADLPEPIIEHIPEVPAAGGWYLRGDIGYKFYQDPKGSFSDPVTGTLRFERESLDNAWMIGAGVGYKWNDYFRTDLTIDYETAAQAKGYAVCGTCTGGFSQESADIDVWTTMINAYWDIGTWYNFTPYVGAGIGAAYVRASNAVAVNPGGATTSYDGTNSEWNFAWALMAGTSYAFTPNWSLDLGYRYKNLGTAKTVRYHNTGTGGSRVKFEDLVAHEARIGVRYNFGGVVAQPAYYPGPITRNF